MLHITKKGALQQRAGVHGALTPALNALQMNEFEGIKAELRER